MNEGIMVAAIDVGTNAVRFLVGAASGEKNRKWRKCAFLRVPIRLGEDVFTCGYITDERAASLCSAMKAFFNLMDAYGVQKYRACATSAMREASNGAQIAALVKEQSGIELETITGTEEARLICAAGRAATGDRHWDDAIHTDVGGGSTEITVYADRMPVHACSYPLGTVRFLKNAVKQSDLERFKAELRDIGGKYAPERIIASGGNINKAQKLLGKRPGDPVSYAELKMLYDSLKGMTFEERIKNFKLNPYRADVIIPALKIFLTVSRLCCVSEIIVPQVGLADGIVGELCG